MLRRRRNETPAARTNATDPPAPAAGGGAAPDPVPAPPAPAPPRVRMTWPLAGDGLELGPGHHPYPLPLPGTAVRFVDRWEPAENEDLFPELGDTPGFPEPDIRANFDADGLGPVPDTSADFVIASHVLEHLANPLSFLTEIHRVLRPGGHALILLPDKRFTFDEPRPVTTLDHLVAEHDAGVSEVSDDHIREFLIATSPLLSDQVADHQLPADEDGWPDVIARHRLRSIHVHCWTEDDFPPVLLHGIRHLGQRWELADVATVAQGGAGNIEFGYLLRRSPSHLDADTLAQRFDVILTAMTDRPG